MNARAIWFFLCLEVLAFCGCAVKVTSTAGTPKRKLAESKSVTVLSDSYIWIIQYQYTNEDLDFVAFTGKPKDALDDVLDGLVSMGSHDSSLTKPDGTEITLPSSAQLYELVDGNYRESKARVSKKEFQLFMASNAQQYTIDSLLAFANKLRDESTRHREK
jgi:hypothetical protein